MIDVSVPAKLAVKLALRWARTPVVGSGGDAIIPFMVY
jgi:hypothetical protein